MGCEPNEEKKIKKSMIDDEEVTKKSPDEKKEKYIYKFEKIFLVVAARELSSKLLLINFFSLLFFYIHFLFSIQQRKNTTVKRLWVGSMALFTSYIKILKFSCLSLFNHFFPRDGKSFSKNYSNFLSNTRLTGVCWWRNRDG